MKYSPFSLLNEALKMPRAPILLLAACAGSLLTAFIAQYAFDQKPCILCIWQRIPFALVILLSILSLSVRSKAGMVNRMLLAMSLIMLINSGIAVFHTGVEQQWWQGTEGCAVHHPASTDPLSVVNLREALLQTEVARCDQITWTFLDYSMANWNILFSFSLSLFAFLAARVHRTGRRLFCFKREIEVKPIVKD